MATSGTHWIERLARRNTPDLAICGSRFSAASLCQWLSGASIELVYCPVSQPDVSGAPKSRQRIRHDFGVADEEVVIVQVSRLDALKGHRVLLQALARLRGVRGWSCWIVGGGSQAGEVAYLRELECAAQASGIADRVTFLGERNDVSEILAAADVFCQPNTAPDAFGLSLVEALQAGLPVVTSAIGGACEIVDASCGMLTEPGDSTALAEALKRLVADTALRGRLGDAARHRPAALCDAPRQMRRIYQVLSSVAAA
jgi:glycosyltransferase involved in cell wall biosynthesis